MRQKRNSTFEDEDIDPMSTVSNLFDIAMVFAVALMVALVTRFNMQEMLSKEDFTMVKNPDQKYMEIITKKGEKIDTYKSSNDNASNKSKGKRVGIAHQLDNGEIIYIPE